MTNIVMLEGTRTDVGEHVLTALQTLARISNSEMSLESLFNENPMPGHYAPKAYNFVNGIAGKTTNNRGQVDISSFIPELYKYCRIAVPEQFGSDKRRIFDNSLKIVILDQDTTNSESGLNWCFGETSLLDDYVILSTARAGTREFFDDLSLHELGHYFGVGMLEGRPNLEESLGTHCTTDLCVMQQHLSVPSARAYAQKRARANAAPYCSYCMQDIKKMANYKASKGYILTSQVLN